MTLHTAKGLEFPVVFVTGWEDGIFPHLRSLADPAELSEERRLAYVGITRARERLYLSRAVMRSAWGQPAQYPPSRFLDDIPAEVLDWRRLVEFEPFVERRSASESLFSGGRSGGSAGWSEGGGRSSPVSASRFGERMPSRAAGRSSAGKAPLDLDGRRPGLARQVRPRHRPQGRRQRSAGDGDHRLRYVGDGAADADRRRADGEAVAGRIQSSLSRAAPGRV